MFSLIYGCAVRTQTKWFRVSQERHPELGEVMLSGWFMDAVAVGSSWFRFAVCPRCFAMVTAGDTKQHPVSGTSYEAAWNDRRREHERWHAETDFPVPEELR